MVANSFGSGAQATMVMPFDTHAQAASLLCGGADTERIVAVGDSLTHDIAGANSAGVWAEGVRGHNALAVSSCLSPPHMCSVNDAKPRLLMKHIV